MKAFKKVTFLFAALTLSLFSAAQSQAQTYSNTAAVSMTFTVNSSLTVSASPSDIAFLATDSSHATANGPIDVITSWNFAVISKNVFTVAYFESPAAALTGGTYNIPASDVFASINGGTATACNRADVNVAAGTPGAICQEIFAGIGMAAQGAPEDQILLSLTSLTPFPVANYAGTITISAQAT